MNSNSDIIEQFAGPYTPYAPAPHVYAYHPYYYYYWWPYYWWYWLYGYPYEPFDDGIEITGNGLSYLICIVIIILLSFSSLNIITVR